MNVSIITGGFTRWLTCGRYLDALGAQSRRRAAFEVRGEVLVDVLEHHVQHELLLVFEARSVADVEQPATKRAHRSRPFQFK